MQKSEAYLLFATIMIAVALLLSSLFYFIKPYRVNFKDDDQINEEILQSDIQDNSWISKISKQNQNFSYPTVIYKLKL